MNRIRYIEAPALRSAEVIAPWAKEFVRAGDRGFAAFVDPFDNPAKNCRSWDEVVQQMGVDLDAFGSHATGAKLIGYERPPGPSRTPRDTCESGKRPYCTCSACW